MSGSKSLTLSRRRKPAFSEMPPSQIAPVNKNNAPVVMLINHFSASRHPRAKCVRMQVSFRCERIERETVYIFKAKLNADATE